MILICPRCGYKTNFISHMKKHFNNVKTCDGILSDLPLNANAYFSEIKEKRFRCTFCPKSFDHLRNRKT
jgi:hypothetical protein